jgi:uncharacterized protein (TIGR03437 family)
MFDGGLLIGTMTLRNGQGQYVTSDLSPGTHTIRANYRGDAIFQGANIASTTQEVKGGATPTTTSLEAAADGTAKTTLTAKVTAAVTGEGAPTGWVEFVDLASNQPVGSVALNGSTAALTIAPQTGAHSYRASYLGDPGFGPSRSNIEGQYGTEVVTLNGASYSPVVAAGGLAVVLGDRLAQATITASAVAPYPSTLGGTSVEVTDSQGAVRMAGLYSVSAGEIGMVMPAGTAEGAATISVTRADGTMATGRVLVTRTSPGLFTVYNAGQVAIGDRPLYLQLYGTGIRNVRDVREVSCTIGGSSAEVVYAGPAEGLEGVDQVSVKVPAGVAGTANVVVMVGTQSSNAVTLTFR